MRKKSMRRRALVRWRKIVRNNFEDDEETDVQGYPDDKATNDK